MKHDHALVKIVEASLAEGYEFQVSNPVGRPEVVYITSLVEQDAVHIGTPLTPAEARELAAFLIDKADKAEEAEEAELENPCSVCWEAEVEVKEYAMCGSCYHNALRSGWTPGASE